ncbi:carbohydrate ABC transporter permease [Clostridium grantii]|uniref:Raffinose/stachyose/melibiose transport system permease protein n=1 Tax=Clostridium grantii DSM 8605 TaxID=1121316 RepID=A0A1M5VB86_9CLOT|nr:sugar ABC transporter permease [Clostridium grantii]SHH72471.1 raffinose/stachyose/melibiose transport system permease protein [Clostridium grantii DSM 8605]
MALKYKTKKNILGYILLIPIVTCLSVFLISPIIISIIRSFTNWSGFSNDFRFVGFKNYVNVFTKSPQFWNGLKVSILFSIGTLILQTIIGFTMAYLIYHCGKRLKKFLQVVLYLPVILPATAVGILWMFMYNPDYGLINSFLKFIGLGFLGRNWIGDYSTALASVIVANTWRYAGFTMMLYLIAFLNIPKELLEAAEVDGANKLDILKKIFIPLTLATTEINAIISFSGSMKAFDMFYITTQGGPGNATRVVSMVTYSTAFQEQYFAKALVMSLIVFTFMLALTITYRKIVLSKGRD